MASIFMRVLDERAVLETLVYVFKNQMRLGKKHLTFTLKHRDGYKEWCRGSIDEVFKHHVVKDIEYGDLVLLEHYNDIVHPYIHFNDKMDVLVLADLSASMTQGAHYIFPKGNDVVYFVIKDQPMASYRIEKNEIISDEVFGKTAHIINNVCGKIDHLRGVYATLKVK